MTISREEFNALKTRVALLETKYEAILAKQDLDTGITGTNYGAVGNVVSNDPKTVTNVTASLPGRPKGFMVKIKDLSTAEHMLKPGQSIVVQGVSESMTEFLAKNYITVT